MKKTETLSYYTQFYVLFDMLERKRIVLGDPAYWEDKTDSKMLEKYAKAKGKDIRALCLTKFPENIHDNILHWKIYAPGKSGCRIDFDKKILENIVKQQKVFLKKVSYLNTQDLKTKPMKKLENLPFLKRSPYIYENEWRILWTGELNKGGFELVIPDTALPDLIRCVKLSPELPKSWVDNLRISIKNRYKIKSVQSWIFKNPDWEKPLTQPKGAKK